MSLRNELAFIVLAIAATVLVVSCGAPDSDPLNAAYREGVKHRMLYVASGSCYGGGATLSVGSNIITAYDAASGTFDHFVTDYNTSSPGDAPVGLSEFNDTSFLVAIENAAGRRIDQVRKDGTDLQLYFAMTAAFGSVVKSLFLLPDKSFLFSKTASIERISAGKNRVLNGANPYIFTPAGVCANTNTNVSSTIALANGKILYTHAAATPNNKTVIVAANGYLAAADCLSAQAAPITTSLPTAALMHSSGKLVVAYGSATSTSNVIYTYDLNTTTNAFTNPVAAWIDDSVVNGPTAITEDTKTGAIYVANGTSTFNTIEKFTLDATTGKLTKATVLPFIANTVLTRCVSGMGIMDQTQ